MSIPYIFVKSYVLIVRKAFRLSLESMVDFKEKVKSELQRFAKNLPGYFQKAICKKFSNVYPTKINLKIASIIFFVDLKKLYEYLKAFQFPILVKKKPRKHL